MSGEGPLTIDALSGIELTVTVLIGETQARISDVVRYTPGTIIVLNARADSAARLLVNGTPVAFGDIVETETGGLAVEIKDVIAAAAPGQAGM